MSTAATWKNQGVRITDKEDRALNILDRLVDEMRTENDALDLAFVRNQFVWMLMDRTIWEAV